MPMRTPSRLGSAAIVSMVSADALNRRSVDDGLVLVGNGAAPGRHREYDVAVGHRQSLGLALCQPFLRCSSLALRAVLVAAAVIGDERVCALLATRNMAAERCRAAFDR